MALISPRVLIPLAVLVTAWGGFHLLDSHGTAVSPTVWPLRAPAPERPGEPTAPPATAPQPATSPATPGGGVPFLPGALQQLNGETVDAATGIYALLQELEDALRRHLELLAGRLEPGR